MSVDFTRDPRLARVSKDGLISMNKKTRVLLNDSTLVNQIPKSLGVTTKPVENISIKTNAQKKEKLQLLNKTITLSLLPSLYKASQHANNLHLSSSIQTATKIDLDSMLRSAVSDGNIDEVCKLLTLKNPPDVNTAQHPPLLTVAASKGHADIVGILLRHGANVNCRSPTQSTPLMTAIDAGHVLVVCVLLQWAANIDTTNRKNDTALLRAIRCKDIFCVRLLLAYGANPIPYRSHISVPTMSPLQLAKHLNEVEIENALLSTNETLEDCLIGIVKSCLPTNARLLEPGHSTAGTSVLTEKSMFFFPVQLISFLRTSYPITFSFTTPPNYRIDKQPSATSSGDNLVETNEDELILLCIAHLSLSHGQIQLSSSELLPSFTQISFNEEKKCSQLQIVNEAPNLLSPLSDPKMPPIEMYVLSNRLNITDANKLTLEKAVLNNQPIVHSSPRNPQSTSVDNPSIDFISDVPGSAFERMLIGVYRIRIEVTPSLEKA